MTRSKTVAAARPTLTTRPNASRKLLARKAIEKLASQPSGDSVEDNFPPAPTEATTGSVLSAAEATVSSPPEPSAPPAELPSAVALPAAGSAPQLAPTWSDEDERAFKAQSARRKAAGYRTRGRDVGAQLITVGSIKPNPNTTVAIIVGLVSERGSVTRGELVDAMASATFAHPKAQPADTGWRQGYVSGAIRNGFLCAVDDSPLAGGED